MGQTLTRHSCTNNSYNDLVQPGEECQFTCQTDDGDFINSEEKLRCTCNDGKSGKRECDWTIGKVKPIDALNKDSLPKKCGFFFVILLFLHNFVNFWSFFLKSNLTLILEP